MEIDLVYSAMIENFDAGIYFVDEQENILVWNAAAESITGYQSCEIKGKRHSDNILDPIGRDGGLLYFNECPIAQTLEDGKIRELEVFIKHKRGHRVPVLMRSIPVHSKDGVSGVTVAFLPLARNQDESARADSVSKLAVIDMFTGLPNRRKLEAELAEKCKEYKRVGASFSIVMIGLTHDDGAGSANEELDSVILETAAAIEGSVRNNDLAGRWSQHEFLVIFAVDSQEKLQLVTNKMRKSVTHAINDKQRRHMTVKIGATMVCGADNAISIVERARYLSNAAEQ